MSYRCEKTVDIEEWLWYKSHESDEAKQSLMRDTSITQIEKGREAHPHEARLDTSAVVLAACAALILDLRGDRVLSEDSSKRKIAVLRLLLSELENG